MDEGINRGENGGIGGKSWGAKMSDVLALYLELKDAVKLNWRV